MLQWLLKYYAYNRHINLFKAIEYPQIKSLG